MVSYMNLGLIVRKRNLLAHISIWTIAALVLAISLTVFRRNLFGIIYLIFFLSFVLLFQSSYSCWARSIRAYCILLILYSTSISLLTYSFQFYAVSSLYKQVLSEQVLYDIGLVVRQHGFMIFFEPFVPLVLTILLSVYLKVFHDDFNRFAYLAEEADASLSKPLTDSQLAVHQTINDSTFIMLSSRNPSSIESTSDPQKQQQQQDQLSTLTIKSMESKKDSRRIAKRFDIKSFLSAASECFWRILETHFIKLVVFMMFRLPIIDVCLMNVPFLVIVIFALKYPYASKCCTLTASWLISFIVILRNVSNLAILRIFDLKVTCEPDAPTPLANNEYSYLDYIGINHDTGNPLNRVDHHIFVLLLITVYKFICIHYEKRSVKDYELSFGIIFSGIGRRESDAGLINSFKYFCNFGFYKFGIEITCLALMIAISNRLDAVAALYGIILILLGITTSKRTLAIIWPMLSLLISLLIPIQYILRLGIPRALCEPYPWEGMLPDFKYWLFLPNYSTNQDATLLLFDFLVLLTICRQSVVFKHMSINSSNPPTITNFQVHHDLSAHQFRLRYLPNNEEFAVDDCFSNYTTQTNYLKSIFFVSIYWITLAVVLVAGATKISLFSLGYLIGCFIFLWLGNDAYLMPLKRLIFSWNWFIFYSTLVIFVKVVLQLYACYLHDYLLNHCYILQLLRVVCYRKMHNEPVTPVTAATCASSLPYDELDILWDGLCLMFLLMQRVVFGCQYFRFLVQEVKAQQILASRGAELIMATQIEEAKAQDSFEKEVVRSVREKMETLKKSDNEETFKAWQRLLNLPHHHQIIRCADIHLFNSSYDDSVSQARTDNWKFKKAFIPDPIGDELERMDKINGISSVLSRWMKGKPLYGNGGSSHASSSPSTSPRDEGPRDHENSEANSDADEITIQPSPQPEQTLNDTQAFDVINDDENMDVGRIRGCWEMLNLIVYSCLLSLTVALNKLSRSYRYVSRRMAVEKNALKKHFNLNDERFKRDPNWRKWVISTLSDTYVKASEQDLGAQSSTSLHRIRSALKVITSSSQDSQSADTDKTSPPGSSSHRQQQQQQRAELTDPEYHFLKLNMFTQFCRALAYVFISNTSLLCQLVIIFNQILTASLLSLPLPLLTFLWGTLSAPRPTKRFWKTVITYIELVIVIKYVCQFPIWNWDTTNINPFYYPNLLGIMNITIIYDLFLLLALFFHRSMLKSLGQWDASVDEGSGLIVVKTKGGDNNDPKTMKGQRDNVAFGNDPSPERDLRFAKSQMLEENIDRSIELPSRVVSSAEIDRQQNYYNYLQDSYQAAPQVIKIDENISAEKQDGSSSSCCSCWSRAYYRTRRSITLFFQHVLNTPYKVETDVYTWMFLFDFINFLILIYGFWAFGSDFTNQTVVNLLDENRIPFSVLIMLLAQFASIIMDRSLYLQKNIGGKIMFQVVLVIGIHFWLFFALPFNTGHTLTLKEYWPPKAFYIFKCFYFLLSAHQIRSGYPRRVLGNCLTKGFGYVNWAAFKIYRAIPLVYELRLYMDWIWTETTLEFRNWSIMEDIFANLFIRKCELTIEEEYPTPRAVPIRRIAKYLTGGAFIMLILAIIWGPLLFFSMSETVGDKMIGLYTTFVVFIARLIRTEPSAKVIYTETPSVDRTYRLVMDIYMMRECGEFELEEKLYSKLLFLYRSPELLIDWSKREEHNESDQLAIQ